MSDFNLQDEFAAVSGAIAGGSFDPQGMNFTDFLPSFAKNNPVTSGVIQGQTLFAAGSQPGATTPSPSSPADLASTGNATPAPTTGGSASPTGLQGYIYRAVLIVMGLIFIGVGLSMFKGPAIIQEAIRQ